MIPLYWPPWCASSGMKLQSLNLMTLPFQMGKLRLREDTWLIQDHTGRVEKSPPTPIQGPSNVLSRGKSIYCLVGISRNMLGHLLARTHQPAFNTMMAHWPASCFFFHLILSSSSLQMNEYIQMCFGFFCNAHKASNCLKYQN